MIWDFFKRLGRQRVSGVQAKVKGKLYSAQAKAKGRASSAFNNSVDGAVNKAKDGVKGKKGKRPTGSKGKKTGSNRKMGWFGRDKDEEVQDESQTRETEAAEYGDKTQYIQMVDERPKECVGWVVALNGPQKGQDFRLVSGKNVLGTAADSEIVLTDAYMSARHAVIRHEDGTFVLVDLDSTNGTFVNDARISKEELIDNDRVRVGKTDLKFKSLY